jgi:hypothetical protein
MVADQHQLVMLLLNRPGFSFSDDIALATLCEAIRFNRLEIVRRLLVIRPQLDTNRRPFDPLSPAPIQRKLPLQPLAAEVAIDFGRHDVLAMLMARPEFQPSVDNNALLRALCGLQSLIVANERGNDAECHLFRCGSLVVDDAGSQDARNAQRILSTIERLLLVRRFEATCRHGSLSVALAEMCGIEMRLQSRRSGSKLGNHEPISESEYRLSFRRINLLRERAIHLQLVRLSRLDLMLFQ